MTTPTRALLGALLASCLLVGCGSDPSGPGSGSGSGSGSGDDGVGTSELTEPTTPEALAAAVLTHVDVDPLSIEVDELDDEAPDDAVSITLRLPLDPDDDQGTLLQVATTATGAGDTACGGDEDEDGCTDDELGDGGRQLVSWEAEEPEEDPGIVQVLTERTDPGSDVLLYLAGPSIPEDLTDDTDLALFTLAGLKEIGLDPAVGPTTTPEMVAAGEELPDEWWVESEY